MHMNEGRRFVDAAGWPILAFLGLGPIIMPQRARSRPEIGKGRGDSTYHAPFLPFFLNI